MKRALFPGSFDPFTVGHKDIVDRALKCVADEVVIAVGVNADKKSATTAEERIAAIRKVYQNEPRVTVQTYEGLTTDFALTTGADFLLRGVRSVKDFEYERDIAEMNRRLTGIETVLLYCSPECACVSSSIVRELMSYGKDVSEFLAEPRLDSEK